MVQIQDSDPGFRFSDLENNYYNIPGLVFRKSTVAILGFRKIQKSMIIVFKWILNFENCCFQMFIKKLISGFVFRKTHDSFDGFRLVFINFHIGSPFRNLIFGMVFRILSFGNFMIDLNLDLEIVDFGFRSQKIMFRSSQNSYEFSRVPSETSFKHGLGFGV